MQAWYFRVSLYFSFKIFLNKKDIEGRNITIKILFHVQVEN